MRTAGSYAIRAICDNCLWKGSVDITRGRPVRDQPCPTCGCRHLRILQDFMFKGGRWRR